MRIRFVEPRPPGHNVYDFALLPRLGLPLMGSMLVEAGHDVLIYCELLSPVDLEDCLSSDLVGISSTTATTPSAYKLADFLKEKGVPVVLGGPHVSFMADEALQHATYVVRGEGQSTIVELVEAIEKGGDLSAINGLSYRSDSGRFMHNPPRQRCSQAEFEKLPAPDLKLIVGHERMVTKPIMTQWGCPFDCEFCSVTAMFSRSVRHRRVDQVIDELAALGAEKVFFHDDNFVVNKARTRELLHAMIKTELTPTWYAQLRADAAMSNRFREQPDHSFLSLLARAGCRMVMIGMEAASDEALAAIGKRQKVATIAAAVEAFHDHGIAVHGMFVAGLDTDKEGSAIATARFARRIGVDTFQLMVETPLPGTHLWDRVVKEGRLLSEDWALFDGHHVVMQPAQTTPLALQMEVLRALNRFYSWPQILRSGIIGALGHLGGIAQVARPSFAKHLPHLARAALGHRWDEAGTIIRSSLPPQAHKALASALGLAALRLYARLQLSSWFEQKHSIEHLARLQAIS